MALTPSTMLPLGTLAPDFALPDAAGGGRVRSRDDFAQSPALLIAFLCNHCPYVQHISASLARFAQDYEGKGLAMIGISANDVVTHPADSPERMAAEARGQGYPFPYLYDASQQVAKAYRAACTPDFFLFDRARRLVYRGQFDASRPGSAVPVTGKDLRAAVDAVLDGREVDPDQRPSLGCSIKWKRGHEPDYF